MNKILMLVFILTGLRSTVHAQIDAPATLIDTMLVAKVQVDPRFELLGKKLADYNGAKAKSTANAGNKMVAGKMPGYRLMVVNSSDRTYAMSVRSYLLKQYGGQHLVHMTFVNPYIKLKFGDFTERSAALNMRSQLMASGIIKGNIYVVPEQVIVKRTAAEMDEENQ